VTRSNPSSVRQVLLHPDAARRLTLAAEGRPLESLTLLTPNVAAGRAVRSRLGDGLVARAVSQLARERLRTVGWRPLRPGERDAFLQRALAEVEFGYLGPLLDRPSTSAALQRLIGELLRADTEPAAVLKVSSGAREFDVAGVFGAYVRQCVQERRFDLSGTEYFARRFGAVNPLRALVHGFTHLDAAQIAFLDTLLVPGSVITLPDPAVQRVRETQRTVDALEAWGFELAVRDPGGSVFPAPVSVHAAPDVETEIRSALRQMRAWLQSGVKAAELALVVRDESTYLPVLLEVSREYGLPLTGAQQLPLAHTPVGALALTWLDALTDGWKFSRTRALLTHPLLGLLQGGLSVARRLSAHFPVGLEAWDPALTWLELEEPASLAAAVQVLERLLLDGGIRKCCRQDALLNAHTSALVEALGGAAKDESPRPREEVILLLRHLLTTKAVPLLLGKGGVRVLNPLGLLGRSFRRAWVLGLADGMYPPRVGDSPLLDSAVRARWAEAGVHVPDAATTSAVEETVFTGAVLGCAGELVLSRPRRSVQGRVLGPSVLLTRLDEQPVWSGAVPFASKQEALLAQAVGGEMLSTELQLAVQTETERDLGQLSEHHGLIGESLWDPEWAWSPSQLHDIGACRFRWFGRKVLALTEEADPDAGEDRRVIGTLLHAALEGALRGWTPVDEVGVLLERAEQALDRTILRERREGRLYAGPLFEIERQEWLGSIERAVRSEDFLPQGWIPEQDGLEKRIDAVLTVGESHFRLRGVVDRVDLTPGGRMVTDYKAGKYISHVQPDVLAQGKLSLEIQLPLYMRALNAAGGRYLSVEGAEVIGAAGRLNDKRSYDASLHEQDLDAFLLGVRRDLAAGEVRPLPDVKADACGFCTVSPVCRYRGGQLVGA
jgi:RecB family exonuclease